MRLGKRRLIDFLEEVGEELNHNITLVAVGGTAMTLLGLKPSTIDVDFTGPSDDISAFKHAMKNVAHGFTVHCYPDGLVFSQILPNNYISKSVTIKSRFKHIELRALHPVDIVVTKIGRLDSRDKQDIEACIKKGGLRRAEIARRAKYVQHVGREENYRTNLDHVLRNFFESS